MINLQEYNLHDSFSDSDPWRPNFFTIVAFFNFQIVYFRNLKIFKANLELLKFVKNSLGLSGVCQNAAKNLCFGRLVSSLIITPNYKN